jgi:hypothetical protein
MPDIDTELFQQLVLGGLVLLLLVGLLILNALGKLKKTGGEGGSERNEEVAPTSAAETHTGSASPPAAATDVYSQPWGEPAPAAATPSPGYDLTPTPAAEPIPEEQPFERDGRWWFKRGDELLVYDEQTGQWTPAPADAPVTQAVRHGSSAPGASPSAGGEGGGFWKCPSCGAVNGATSATCRMCFTPRPG